MLALWDESHLVLVYDLVNILLNLFYQYFVKDFCGYRHGVYWSIPIVFAVVFVVLQKLYSLASPKQVVLRMLLLRQ